MGIFLEYIIAFVLVFIFFNIRSSKRQKKYDVVNLPIELLYLKKKYNITISKDNYDMMRGICVKVNAFIVSTDYIILMYLLNNWILRIVIGIILLILLIIICYGLLARYYLRKEGR